MNNEVREVLVEAKNILGRGWHQGSYSDGYGKSFCIRGAIAVATDCLQPLDQDRPLEDFQNRVTLELDACRMVQDNLPEPWESIPGWNDDQDTVHSDVLAVMDKAISACPL